MYATTIEAAARKIIRETATCDCCPTLDERAALHLATILLGVTTYNVEFKGRGKDRDLAADNSRLEAELHRARARGVR